VSAALSHEAISTAAAFHIALALAPPEHRSAQRAVKHARTACAHQVGPSSHCLKVLVYQVPYIIEPITSTFTCSGWSYRTGRQAITRRVQKRTTSMEIPHNSIPPTSPPLHRVESDS